jgi:hypothetical protein
MDAMPDPGLIAMPLEKRPGDRPYLLDASLYGNHYYLYFGVTPLLTGFLPFELIVGRELPCELLVAAQATLGCWIGLAMLGLLRAEFFPRAGHVSLLVAALAMAFATAVPMTLRKSEVYEAAVTAGFVWGMAMLFFGMLSVLQSQRRSPWLICASACAGLAVGSRPNLLAGSLALGVVLGWTWWRAGREEAFRRRLGWAAAAIVPAATVGVGLALYNYARFGGLLEFGHRFQVGSVADNYVSLRYFLHNLTVYYLTPPSAGWFYPFFSPGIEGARPSGYIGIEYIHGEFWFLPWVLGLLVLGLLFWKRIWRAERLAVIAGMLVCWFLINFSLVASVSARANRYMLDFHPPLVLLCGLALLAWSRRGRWWRLPVAGGSAILLVAGFINVMESFQVHEFFRNNNPAGYAAIERVANRLAWPLERLTSPEFGAVEMKVVFPDIPAGTREPLLSTGAPILTNTISFYSLGAGRARMEFDHEGQGGASGPDFEFTPGQAHIIKIWLGSLLPPIEHPWFDGVDAVTILRLKQTVAVQLDGRTVFFSGAVPHDASPGQVRIGPRVIQYSDDRPRFSGRIENVRRTREPPPVPGPITDEESLVYSLKVLLPRDRFGVAEPLVATGTRARGDVLLVEYSSPETVRFGHDQLGGGIEWSRPVHVDYMKPQDLEFSFEPAVAVDPLAGPNSSGLHSVVRLGGREVPIGRNPHHVFSPANLSVGCNTVGASSCRIYFAGTILSWKYLGDRVRREAAGEGKEAATRAEFVLPGDLSSSRAEPLLAYRNAAGARGVLAVRGAGDALVQLGWIEAATSVWSGRILASAGSAVRLQVRRRADATARALSTGGVSAEAFFRGRSEFEWNGETVFQPRLTFFDSPIVATAGWSSAFAERADLAQRFTGEVRVFDGRPTAAGGLVAVSTPRTVRMAVRFPDDRVGICEPLLTTGRTGAADSVYVRYGAAGRISFGFDHWGVGGPEQPPVKIDYTQSHLLEVTFGEGAWAHSGPGQLQLKLDGHLVIDAAVKFHAAQAGEIVLGENLVGLSTSVPEFSGVMYPLERR